MKNRKKNKEMLTDLKERFGEGEKMSVDDVVEDYFSPKTAYSFLIAKGLVRGWMSCVKRHFKLHLGLWFGALDDDGNYGVITTEEEVRFAMMRYYRYMKGVSAGAGLLVNTADSEGLLPEGMTNARFLVAKVEEEEDE